MDKDIKQLNYGLMLEGYIRHLEEEEELTRKTKDWLDKRDEYEHVITRLIYDIRDEKKVI